MNKELYNISERESEKRGAMEMLMFRTLANISFALKSDVFSSEAISHDIDQVLDIVCSAYDKGNQ